jgi:hypothetical protein
VLDTAIPERNKDVIALTVDTVGGQWRELGESFPAAKDTSVRGGLAERRRARDTVRGIVLSLRELAMAAAAGDFYRQQLAQASAALKAAEAWSLFNPQVREAHFAALNQLAKLAK